MPWIRWLIAARTISITRRPFPCRPEGFTLQLKSRDFYDGASQTQFSTAIYALCGGDTLLKSEEMDFQMHLYRLGETEGLLREMDFAQIRVYSSFAKEPPLDDRGEMLLYKSENA